ncbi:MAG: hypothetical protein RMJ33_03785 [Saprospiraceae bacterium]|nr:hypothetical protein [Saprospiraceae bacterium]MDW8228941.1 hypothetical protein [Saprospiraceae bacterium]
MQIEELKSEIKRLLTEGLDLALQRLGEVLRAESEQYNLYLGLRGRYTAYLTERIQGVRSNAELDILYNRMMADLLALVELLDTSDFRQEDEVVAPQQPKRGHLLYHIPDAMALGREHACRVRIAYQQEDLLRNWKEQAGQDLQNIRVAEVMAVEMLNALESRPFHIRSISDTIQFLEDADYTEWLFYVRPLLEGAFPLLLKVSVIEVIGGRELRKDVVIEEQVVVSSVAEEQAETLRSLGLEVALHLRPEQDEAVANVLKNILSQTAPAYSPPPRPSAPQAPQPEPAAPRAARRGRSALLLLAFIVCALGLTWSFTTSIQRDYWVAAWSDSEEAYTAYIEKHKHDPAFFAAPQCEKAYFRRIEISDDPVFVRKYLEKFGQSALAAPERQAYAQQRLHTLEQAWVERIRTAPTNENVGKYVEQFPEMTLLPEVVAILQAHPEVLAEQMDILEQAVVQQAHTDSLSPQKMELLQRARPDNGRIRDIIREH